MRFLSEKTSAMLYRVERYGMTARRAIVATPIDQETGMMLYHRGVALHPTVGRSGNLFVSRVSILEEDGEETSLGGLGYFSNRESAMQFAVRCGTAFIDGEPMPMPPCHLQLVETH
jgi:hypothetical protein